MQKRFAAFCILLTLTFHLLVGGLQCVPPVQASLQNCESPEQCCAQDCSSETSSCCAEAETPLGAPAAKLCCELGDGQPSSDESETFTLTVNQPSPTAPDAIQLAAPFRKTPVLFAQRATGPRQHFPARYNPPPLYLNHAAFLI